MPRNKRRRSRRRAPREVQSRSDDSCENPSDGMQPSEEEASVSAAESENSQHEEGAEGTTDSDDKEIISDMLIHGSENMCATSLTQGQSDVNHQSLLDDKASPKYRVESPGVSHPGLIIKKSHSFGDTTVQIQELSSGGSSLVNSFDNPGNVSEPESSELEEDPLQDPSTPTNEDKLEFDITAEGASSKDLSSEQDEKIRELISSFMESAPSREKSPPEVIAQRKLDKTRKRAAIESHFAPQFMNPRFLDSIREESSDTDGGSDRLSVDRNPKEIDRDEDMFDEEDDDVFIDNAKVSKKANAVFPKGVTLNLSERRKHVSALRKPVSGIIREEPQCVLLDTKILEPESIPGSSSTWETTKTDEVQGAEVVYLESGSSSASELDYSADGDGEDSVTEDVDVRIETPVIESDVSAFVPPDEQSELLLPTSCKSESESIADSHSEPHLEILSEPASEIVSQALSKSEDEQFDPVSEPRLESENEQLNPISEPLSMGASEQLDPMSEPLSISASEVLDPMSEPLSEIVSDHPPSPDPLPNPDECDIPDFHRQDSSGSISSQTHSTSSHSQCTARYMASSMTDLEMDFEPSAIAGAPESPCDQNTDMASSTTPQSLRQQCLDRLSTMPYGNIVLRELADVSQNISDLLVKAHGVSKPATPSPPPVPALPARELLIDVSDPFQDGNFYSSDPQIARHATPPPVPARPTAVHPNSAHDSLHRDGSRDGIACAKDDNRLLAIIRESENEHQQSAPAAAESSATDQVRDVTMVKDPREFDNMFEALSKRFSNYELGHGAANHAATTKRFSNIETSSYESCRRVENGRVVVDEMKRHSEKITDDNGDVSKSVESESSAMPKDKVGANCGMDENSKGGFLNRDSGTTKICGDDFLRVTRREKVDDNFDFVPRRRAGDRRAWVSRNNLTVVDESPENVTRPLAREDNLCRGQRSATEIKAPRLSELDASGTEQHFDLLQNKVSQRRSMIDTTPITPHVGTGRRLSLPRDFHEKQLQYIRQKEAELQAEFEKLELDRKRLEEEITTMRMSTVRDESQSKRSSLLSEEEIFRQQMHSEWLDKVAEREERRLQKVMKVTKSTDDIPVATKSGPADIENEFLRKVKERRTKLSMPADSDWESGAESQPQPRESQREPTVHNVEVKVVDGEKEATINKLPKHLQEFAESFTTTTHEERTTKVTQADTRAQPNEIIHPIRLENSNSESDYGRSTMTEVASRQTDGVGGQTLKEGMPVVLRSEIRDDNQTKWYKKVYNTIHKAKDDDDYVTVRYKTRRGRYPYRSNGYMSEPEPNYDSDYSYRYTTLDRRRTPSAGSQYDDSRAYGTMPNPIRSGHISYRNQPGRIEDYTPGRSSVSEREKREWWDEVMDIFDGHLEQQRMATNYSQGYLSRALKEQGYESDSSLVFRKRDDATLTPLSPVEQKLAYRSVQAGGEPPLQGFRKPAPEKPKENAVVPPPPPPKGVSLNGNLQSPESPRRYVETDVNIHYRSPIRYEFKDPIPEEELARRQAETMKKLYQEERRRKYLQELQDMSNRRHTDTHPNQKSPVPLNRFDDFLDEDYHKQLLPRTVARALFNFQGQSARELSFKKGDIIYIRRQIDRNWYEGEHNAMLGLLPVNYVEIISKDGVRCPPKPKPAEGQARAKYNFNAQSAIELSLNKGELVKLTRRVDDNWFEGRVANRKGIFPVAYVEVLTDIGSEDAHMVLSKPVGSPAAHSLITPTQEITPYTRETRFELEAPVVGENGVIREMKTVKKTEVLHVDTNSDPIPYRALYKYRPQNPDEMEMEEGDIVYVLEKCDDGWFVGTSQRTGCFGTFPGNYVEKL
ncbi:uncharacterized protein LOC129792352 isoform X26 [Lutzomyia longipalpis]|uniref:uncharacterized protein LOC129792352 isoform X26 n=1 Tax=Lutzomyia longipalpis TaxID=7200 RepID=UPI002483F4D6|nr:uncharacterized protein LOC129792352 isoform X26 [Lutzomyia longipalpis]